MSTHPMDSHLPPGYEDASTRYGKNGYSRVSPEEPNDLGRRASEPRYVYYHVYAVDGALPCQKPYGDNPYLGRIKATSVPPPHTSASLKRALVQVEGLPDPTGALTGLFQTKDARTAMGKDGRVDILTGDIGATAQTALALVFLTAPKEPLNAPSTDEEDGVGNMPYLYYRLYNPGGEEASVRPFDTAEPALGRIKRDLISPPRNVLSVKRRIAKVEGKPIYGFADFFTDMQADNGHPSDALVADAAGASKYDPIFLVQPERRPGLLNRPVMILELPSEPTRRYSYSGYSSASVWLSPSKGEILFTDGVRHLPADGIIHVYHAVDGKGKRGYISACKMRILHFPFDRSSSQISQIQTTANFSMKNQVVRGDAASSRVGRAEYPPSGMYHLFQEPP
ncbi:hypothetical protein B0H11DRAFT_1875280 [Mycena galericulata]|nr:hypothetical protein B0H11DRAFT_1875280 [Mycena galericulata]